METVWCAKTEQRHSLQHLTVLNLGIYPAILHRYIHRILHTRRLTAALFTVVSHWKQPKCLLTVEWANKVWYSHNKLVYSNENEQACYMKQHKYT